jgi:hypothetical protein
MAKWPGHLGIAGNAANASCNACPLLRNPGDGIRLSDHLDGADGEAVFRHACAIGLEGIVAKRRDRPYRSGRSPDRIKVKNPDCHPQPG